MTSLQAAQIQRCFAVKPGRDALLDVARATFNDNFDDINKLVAQYREEFGIGCAKHPFATCQYNSGASFQAKECASDHLRL